MNITDIWQSASCPHTHENCSTQRLLCQQKLNTISGQSRNTTHSTITYRPIICYVCHYTTMTQPINHDYHSPTSVPMEDRNHTITRNCFSCKRTLLITVRKQDWTTYKEMTRQTREDSVKNVFAYMTADKRKPVHSGFCVECYDSCCLRWNVRNIYNWLLPITNSQRS